MTLQRWRQFKASKSECGSHSVPTTVWWSQQVSELEVCFRPYKSQDFFTPFGLKWLVLIQSVLHFNLFFRLVLLFFFLTAPWDRAKVSMWGNVSSGQPRCAVSGFLKRAIPVVLYLSASATCWHLHKAQQDWASAPDRQWLYMLEKNHVTSGVLMQLQPK